MNFSSLFLSFLPLPHARACDVKVTSPMMEVDMWMSGIGYVDVVFVERNGNRETWKAKCPFCKQHTVIVREQRIMRDGCVDVEWCVEEKCKHFCNLFPLAYTAMFSSSEGR